MVLSTLTRTASTPSFLGSPTSPPLTSNGLNILSNVLMLVLFELDGDLPLDFQVSTISTYFSGDLNREVERFKFSLTPKSINVDVYIPSASPIYEY